MYLFISAFLTMVSAVPQLYEGFVTGQISNRDGTPAVRVRVMAMDATSTTAPSFVSLTETDLNGRYRLDRLAPGRYFLVAGLVNAPTYYPGVANILEAQTVPVTRDGGLPALNFKMATLLQAHVRGHVTVSPDDAGSQPIDVVLLRPGQDPLRTALANDGSFEFPEVPPGNYNAAVRAVNRTTSQVPISVHDQDVTGVELVLSRSIQLQGRVVVDGGGTPPNFRFKMEPGAFGLVSGPIRPNAQGAFDLNLPENLRFELYAFPPAYLLKSMTYGQTDLMREPLTAGGTELVVTFSRKP